MCDYSVYLCNLLTHNLNLKQARADLDGKYRAIVERINALVVVEGVQTWEQFIRTLNVVIAKYAANMARRTGGKKEKGG
jgi:flagellar biosynthesis chaperone FliJ